MSGKIIAFEGLDCSFKETNSKAYLDYLLSKGEKAALFSFPRYAKKQSIFVVDYLAGKYGDQEDLHPAAISTFYMIDMFDCIKKEVFPLLEEDYTIIFDRYWYSNIFYRIGLYRSNVKFSDASTEYTIRSGVSNIAKIFALPKADIIVKLKSDPNVMLDFVHNKNSANDQHESNDAFLLSVAEVFNTIDLSKYVHDKVLDVYTTENGQIRSKEDIFADILRGVGHE